MTKFKIYWKFKNIVKQGFLGCHLMGCCSFGFTLYLQCLLEREEWGEMEFIYLSDLYDKEGNRKFTLQSLFHIKSSLIIKNLRTSRAVYADTELQLLKLANKVVQGLEYSGMVWGFIYTWKALLNLLGRREGAQTHVLCWQLEGYKETWWVLYLRAQQWRCCRGRW